MGRRILPKTEGGIAIHVAAKKRVPAEKAEPGPMQGEALSITMTADYRSHPLVAADYHFVAARAKSL
jgi:hypothetical protein